MNSNASVYDVPAYFRNARMLASANEIRLNGYTKSEVKNKTLRMTTIPHPMKNIFEKRRLSFILLTPLKY